MAETMTHCAPLSIRDEFAGHFPDWWRYPKQAILPSVHTDSS